MRWLILVALATACPGGDKKPETPDAALAKAAPPPAPPDAPSPPPKLATELTIKIAPDGALELDGQPISAAAFPDAIRAAIAADPKTAFTIEPVSGTVKHEHVVKVVDMLKQAGGSKINIKQP